MHEKWNLAISIVKERTHLNVIISCSQVNIEWNMIWLPSDRNYERTQASKEKKIPDKNLKFLHAIEFHII